MKEKFNKFLQSQIPVAIIFFVFGVFLIGMPAATLNVICKFVFGVILIVSGILSVISQARSSSNKGLVHLYTGVISLIMGIFLFSNPQIVVKILPWILGGFVIADLLWLVNEIRYLRKNQGQQWETFTVAALVFLILAVLMIVNPFGQIRKELVFCGWVMVLKAISDVVLSILIKKQKKALHADQDAGYTVVPADPKKRSLFPILPKKPKKEKEKTAASDDIIDYTASAAPDDVIYAGTQEGAQDISYDDTAAYRQETYQDMSQDSFDTSFETPNSEEAYEEAYAADTSDGSYEEDGLNASYEAEPSYTEEGSSGQDWVDEEV